MERRFGGNCRSFVWKDVRKGCIIKGWNQVWWTEEVVKAVGKNEGGLEEGMEDQG